MEQPGNRADAQAAHRILVVDQPHDFAFGGIDLVACRGLVGFADVTVAIGCGTQNRDLPGLGAMALAAAGPFENLRPFVFGDHALELQHQLIFGRVGMRRLQEDRLDSVTSELFGQQYLIGIFSTQAIG